MKIALSAGGRFHAINLAHQLNKRNCLQKLFSFSYTKGDENLVDKDLVHSINSCKILDQLFHKLRLSHFINASVFNSYKDNLFDYLVSREIRKLKHIDLFVGWAHYSLKSMATAKLIGAKTIIESGSCHIKEQQELLINEYAKWGLKFSPIYQPTIDKMLKEYDKTDYIMTLSSFSKNSFIKHGISPKKLLNVPCSVDVDFFYSQETTAPRQQNKFRVIFVGLISLRKGIPYLIDAWNKLNLPENSTELILVGNIQKDMYQVMPQLKLRKNIIFFGSCNRDQLKKLYQDSSVFVLPSIEDGFGMVAGEAMASGLPVICSKNTGVSEIIENSASGFLVEAFDSDDLASKILFCYKNPEACHEIGTAGKKRILDFTWKNYGDNIYNIYQKLLQGDL